MSNSRAQDRVTNVAEAKRIGFKVIRVFAANRYATPAQVADRLSAMLDLCAQYDIFVIASLTDLYEAHGTYPMGDNMYYGAPNGGYVILQPSWYLGGFEDNYWPMVEHVVGRLRDHPALFAWEIGNELEGSFNPSLFVAFMNEIRSRIRAIDPNHMITTGMLSANHAAIDPYSEQALALERDFDFVTWHRYNEEDWRHQEVIANRLGKPLVIEEVGFSRDLPQYNTPAEAEAALNRDVQKWLVDRGAAGYMHWGFQAAKVSDGDGTYGIDHSTNEDRWGEMTGAYHAWAVWTGQNRPPYPCPTSTATPTPTRSPSPSPTWTPKGQPVLLDVF